MADPMGSVGWLVRLLVGLAAIAAVALTPLTRLTLAGIESECERRRAAFGEPGFYRSGLDVCPRDDARYLYVLESDSSVAVRCPHGHGVEPPRFRVWTDIP